MVGWLDHSFSVFGMGVSRQFGQTRIETSRASIGGRSDVHSESEGISRDNLLGDGFVAVLEENLSDTSGVVRVAVPSGPAARKCMASLLLALGKGFGEESYRDLALKSTIPAMQNAADNDVSHVSDRLSSILRIQSGRRPTVTVIGSELTEHAILAAAIQFENDEKWYRLFPVALFSRVTEIASANARNAKYIS